MYGELYTALISLLKIYDKKQTEENAAKLLNELDHLMFNAHYLEKEIKDVS